MPGPEGMSGPIDNSMVGRYINTWARIGSIGASVTSDFDGQALSFLQMTVALILVASASTPLRSKRAPAP
jgi:hypothetical protein